MTEPFFVAQTFDPGIVGDLASGREWIERCAKEVAANGGTHCRATVSGDKAGILFEGWEVRPVEEGPPRWSFKGQVCAMPSKK